MKVVIATEGSTDIGIGHITRCSSIADGFKDAGITAFFVVNGDETVAPILAGREYHLFDWVKDRERLIGLAAGADIVIVDSYLAPLALYDDIASNARLGVYIDDSMRLDYPRGIVVNGCIFAQERHYPQREGLLYMLGSGYIPLRKEYWDARRIDIKEDVQNILVMFGGSDARNMTPAVLHLLSHRYPDIAKFVVVGHGVRGLGDIRAAADSKTELAIHPDTAALMHMMSQSDIAISAGGQVLYELAVLGVPTIAVCVARNQEYNISGWLKAGFIRYAGFWQDEGVVEKAVGLTEEMRPAGVREEMAAASGRFVDGNGSRRLCRAILEQVDHVVR